VLKWPNDVLFEGRKLAGVLAEARHGDRIDVYLGVGINVRQSAEMPAEVAAIATSIEGAGVTPPSMEALLAALSGALELWVERIDYDALEVVAQWRARLSTLGHRVRLGTPRGEVEGKASDVTHSGELVLRLDDGSTETFAAGDVTVLDAGAAG
jgi:BirA family transcriptional regulator, biotin operon repressor / biotin---[acetyl-CoA-carboxylase] ligase